MDESLPLKKREMTQNESIPKTLNLSHTPENSQEKKKESVNVCIQETANLNESHGNEMIETEEECIPRTPYQPARCIPFQQSDYEGTVDEEDRNQDGETTSLESYSIFDKVMEEGKSEYDGSSPSIKHFQCGQEMCSIPDEEWDLFCVQKESSQNIKEKNNEDEDFMVEKVFPEEESLHEGEAVKEDGDINNLNREKKDNHGQALRDDNSISSKLSAKNISCDKGNKSLAFNSLRGSLPLSELEKYLKEIEEEKEEQALSQGNYSRDLEKNNHFIFFLP